MFAAISAALAHQLPIDRSMALSAIGPYVSRGKGRGTVGRNWLRPTQNARPPHQGKQEMARRRRHISLGTLRAENGLAVAA